MTSDTLSCAKKTAQHDAIVLSSSSEQELQQQLVRLFRTAPLPDDEILPNLGLFLTSKSLARLLFFYEIYQKILTQHGVIIEFGVRWGQTLAVLAALRGSLEPFNRHRRIIGFDTFTGFKGLAEQDGSLCRSRDGSFSVGPGYQEYLERLLVLNEALSPVGHLRKFELVAGDAVETVPAWFACHPETVVSLAIFDFDIYRPTRAALEAVRPHLCKGSVLVFDELCDEVFPGETVALRETLGLRDLRIQRLPMAARVSYVVLE